MLHSKKETFNGNTFQLRTWQTENPKANILIVHGYAEHSARYDEVAKLMNQEGYSVYAFDRRGEGASEGKRAKVHDFSVQVEDLKAVIGKIEKGDKKFFLYGHSLGGLVVCRYIIDYDAKDVDGMILSGPLLEADEDMSPFLQKISGFVGRVLPWMPVVKLDTKLLTRDDEERKKYEDDPLVYHGSTYAKTAMIILRSMKYSQKNFDKVKLPFLVLHGSADKVTNPKGSRMLYDNASSEDKTIKIFDGWFHELMREPGKEEFFEILLGWIAERI